MKKFVVAVPSVGAGGLEARRSHHFGKSPSFTVVEVTSGGIGAVRAIPNELRPDGGCRAAAQLLASAGIDTVVATGIGPRPLSILGAAGISVYFDRERKTVAEAVDALSAGELQPITEGEVCSHHHGRDHGRAHEHSC